jgi:hypothetical protein
MIDFKRRQEAGETVEREMLEFLLQYAPAQELKVSDIQMIARAACSIAFAAFSGPQGEPDAEA